MDMNERARAIRRWVCVLVLPLVVGGSAIFGATAPRDTEEKPRPDSAASATLSVLASLQRTLTWYEGARAAMQSIDGVLDADLARGEQQTAQHIVQRAFDTARARAALIERSGQAETPDAPAQQKRAARAAQLRAGIARDERGITDLQERQRTAAPATRPALERQLTTAKNRLELSRTRLDFLSKLGQVDSTASGDDIALTEQIRALQDSVPELTANTASTTIVNTSSPGAAGSSGARTLLYRLLALQRNRRAFIELARATDDLARATRTDLNDTQQAVRPMVARLETLAGTPAVDGVSLAADQAEFRTLLERTKLSGAIVLSLREESALLQRYSKDVQTWTRALDREVGHVFRGLALELLGVGFALAAILVCSVLWRIAVVRYVSGDYQRRLLLTARHVVVGLALVLVLVFHFASELTALIAALGFVAAGIAFALQNVILAVAGYFSMIAPHGIRVGDRVSLQGPFGYVHGQVIEIGVVRTRLEELAGDPLQPTGRTMVFPNSVAFTGSFIKHPPSSHRRRDVGPALGATAERQGRTL
jgi:Mechanosensitive ion channel